MVIDPGAMIMQQNLWAPWRIRYIQGLIAAPEPKDERACFLCDAAHVDLTPPAMAERLMLVRDERGVLLLNRYPYTNGHLLAAPLRHVADLTDLEPAERTGLMELAALGTRVLQKTVHPQGMNIGMNLGRCAGAGVPGHCHMHIVPRWAGDVNFMDTVGQVRVIPQALEEAYAMLLVAVGDVGASESAR
jgi:ATP adenylyltransferase